MVPLSRFLGVVIQGEMSQYGWTIELQNKLKGSIPVIHQYYNIVVDPFPLRWSHQRYLYGCTYMACLIILCSLQYTILCYGLLLSCMVVGVCAQHCTGFLLATDLLYTGLTFKIVRNTYIIYILRPQQLEPTPSCSPKHKWLREVPTHPTWRWYVYRVTFFVSKCAS